MVSCRNPVGVGLGIVMLTPGSACGATRGWRPMPLWGMRVVELLKAIESTPVAERGPKAIPLWVHCFEGVIHRKHKSRYSLGIF